MTDDAVNLDMPQTVAPSDTLSDEDLAALLCDENGDLMTPDVLQTKMIDVNNVIGRCIKAINKWCTKQSAKVDGIVNDIVSSEMAKCSPSGADVAKLLHDIECELIQWIANQISVVGEFIGGLPKVQSPFPQGTSAGGLSGQSGTQSGTGVPTESGVEVALPGSFTPAPAGAGFGGETAVGGSATGDTASPPDNAPSSSPCASLSDEERVIWGCETEEDAVRLKILGVFVPQLAGKTVKEFLEDSWPAMKDDIGTSEAEF